MSHTPTPSLELVPFHGTMIAALRDGEDVRVAVRPVCEGLGIDPDSQMKRLKRQPWACTVIMTVQMPGDDQSRDHAFVDRRTFTMWLATIDTSRIKNDRARELLVTYQREATDALDRYFHDGGAVNPRASEHQVNALIRQAQMQMELCQAAKGLIHPDHLEARARVVLARGLGEHATLDEGTRPLYTADYLKGKNLSQKRTKSIAPMFGKRVKAAYVTAHGVEPKRYPLNLANGQTREVYAYTEADRSLMDQVWDEFYATQGVLA
ncbi:MAG: phage antirepressor N-terminal domain-containing protein [Propionibacteriaceae bacterium]|nr:phage antirepressor N-terminal domain-containing protein [Propionibacteriaceae bacterium]